MLDSIRIDATSPTPTPSGFDTIGAEVTSPLEVVRGSLTSGAGVELFRVTTDEPTNWRLTTLPEFDGRTWRLPKAICRPSTTPGTPNRTAAPFTSSSRSWRCRGTCSPPPPIPSRSRPAPTSDSTADTSTLLTTGELASGDRFTIVSEAPDVTLDELRAATTDNPPDEMFLELPDDVPGVVSDLATEVTAGATTDADKMIALQDWFRSEFNYVLDGSRQ